MRLHRATLAVLCTGVVLANVPLARAQDATSASLPEHAETGETVTTPRPKKKKVEPSREIAATASSQKPVAVTEQMPAEEPATPAMPVYQAKRAKITGNGVCIITVDTASGKVTDAMMAQSTGDGILDKATINTFRRWRFKPGTVSQVRVPIDYE